MKTKDRQDEAWRHACRNGLIQSMFNELNQTQKFSLSEIYLLLEKLFGLHENQIRTISALPKNESTVSVDDLSLFVVILQRNSSKLKIEN